MEASMPTNNDIAQADPFHPTRAVCQRYRIVDRTVDRWIKNPNVGFPEPDLEVNGRRYWKESTLQRFERRRATSKREAA
jgi:hypothetical protein